MKRKLFLAMSLVLVCLFCLQLKADQLDAYPENQHGGPPPQENPPPEVRPYPGQAPEPQYEPRRRGRWGFWRREYPDDIWSHPRFNAKVFYNFASTGNSTNSSNTNNFFSTTGAFSVDVTNAPGFSAEVFVAPPFGFGFSGGLEYELSRNINDINRPNNTTDIYTSKPTVQFTNIYFNGIFRFLSAYIPVGLNYSIPNFSSPSGNGLITSSTFTGNLGFQFGIGFLFAEHFSFELEDKILHFNATSSSASTTLNWGDVSLSGLQLNFKYAF